MKIRILGCGTSSGVPRIGNDWGDCDPSEPRNRRTRSSIVVESGGERLLVDCGPDMREQLLAAGLGGVDAILISHDHADHCHGIDDVRQLSHLIGRPVPILARANTIQRLSRRFGYVFEGTPLYPAIVSPVEVEGEYRLGQSNLRFVDQPHGGITSLGMRIEEGQSTAAYAIDFHDLTDEMSSLYEGVDVWICDCLRREQHPTHAHLDAVLGWAKTLNVGQLLLTHLDKSMDYATLVSSLPDWAAPAFDGQEILL